MIRIDGIQISVLMHQSVAGRGGGGSKGFRQQKIPCPGKEIERHKGWKLEVLN